MPSKISSPENIVFDSSALLVFLFQEKGYQELEKYIDLMCISTVNFSEVISIFERNSLSTKNIHPEYFNLKNFTTEDSIYAGSIYNTCQPLGLSLGDKACLALGKRLDTTIVTADKTWTKLSKKLKLDIQVIR